MKRLARALLAVLVLLGTASLFGALVPGPKLTIATSNAAPSQEIWLLRGAIHTDFVIPLTSEARRRLTFAQLPENADYALIGWGSRAFYTSTGSYRDLSLATIWQAATGDYGVLRIQPVPPDAPPPDAWAHQSLTLGPDQFTALLAALKADVAGPALPGVHLAPGDAFYPTVGRFWLGRSCNQWVSERLRMAGLTAGSFTPTPGGLRVSVWWFGLFDNR